MSSSWLGRRRTRVGSAAVLVTLAAGGILIPLAGTAQAAVTNVTALSTPANTYQNVNTSASFTITTSPAGTGTVSTGDVDAIITSGPDASALNGGFGGNAADATDINCTSTLDPAMSQQVTCVVPNTTARGPGVDNITFFADKNGDNIFQSSEPFSTATATFVGPINAVTLSGPTSAAANTCTVYTVGAIDSGGRGIANQAIVIKGIQTAGTATALQFCSPADPDLDIAANTARKTVTTSATGGTVTFGIQTDNVNPLTLQAFVDGNADNILQPATEPNQVMNVTITGGGAAAADHVTVTPSTTTPVAGDVVTVNVVVTGSGNPIAGVSPTWYITGANSTGHACCSTTAPATDSAGKTSFTYTATNSGTDTIFVYVNQGGALSRDPSEPQGTAVVTVGAAPVNSNIDLTCVGSIAGGSAASTSNATVAENCVDPTSQNSETFTAKVTAVASPQGPVQGATVRFTVPQNVSGSGTSANDATPVGPVDVLTNSNGIATFTLTNPNPVNGDAYRVTATIAGSSPVKSDDAYVRFEDSTAGTNAAPSSTNVTLGSSFPATAGSIVMTPDVVTTQVGTAATFTSTVRDQFGVLKPGVNTFYQVTGRNTVAPNAGIAANRGTDANGQSTFTYTDTGSLTSASGSDTVRVVSDANGDGLDVSSEPSDTSSRFYTLEPTTAAAIEGGVGTPSQQFAASSPYAPVTSDDTASKPIDVTHTRANMTPTQVFFEIRNASNTSNLPGNSISVASSGVGAIVGANNAPLSSPQVITVAPDGYARLNVLSTQTGTQTLTATADGKTKVITVTWTNTNTGRTLTLTPGTKSAAVGSTSAFTSHVVDLYNNPVAGQVVDLSLTGPGQFGNGSSFISGTTDSNGDFVANVTSNSAGTITITATASGAQFGAAANSPNSGDAAGKGTATSTLTSSTAPVASASTTTISVAPATQTVNQFVTATGTIRDASGNAMSGQNARIYVSGATTQSSSILTSDSAGHVALQFTSATPGTATVRLSVVNSGGVEQFSKTTTAQFVSDQPAPAPRPSLSQTSSRGVVVLSLRTQARFAGLTVYFFRRSGITGKVVPAGTGVIQDNGVATRVLHQTTGQILAIYSKIIGATNIDTPYSNDVRFRVQ